MLGVIARERLARPAIPAFPHVMPASRAIRSSSDGQRSGRGSTASRTCHRRCGMVVRDERLPGDVELVETEVVSLKRTTLTGSRGGSRRRDGTPTSITNVAGLEMRGRVLEARDLFVLCDQVHDRVEDGVDERELSSTVASRSRRSPPGFPRRPASRAASRPSPPTGRSRERGCRAARAATRSGRCRCRTRARLRVPRGRRGRPPKARRRPGRTSRRSTRRTVPLPARRSSPEAQAESCKPPARERPSLAALRRESDPRAHAHTRV